MALATRVEKLESVNGSSRAGGSADLDELNSLRERVNSMETEVMALRTKSNVQTASDAGTAAAGVSDQGLSKAVAEVLKTVRTEASALEVKMSNMMKQRDTNVAKLKIQCRNLSAEHTRDRNKAEAALKSAREALEASIAAIRGRVDALVADVKEIHNWQEEQQEQLQAVAAAATVVASSAEASRRAVGDGNATRRGGVEQSPKTTIMKRAVIPTARRANTGLRPLWKMWEDIDEEVQREMDACHTLLISRSQALETGDPSIISEVRNT